MTIIIIYDTITGNNEGIANNISEGAQSEGSKVLVYKIGTKFPISILEDADVIVVGSPSFYGNMTPEISQFLDNLYDLNKTGKIKMTDKKAAVFGSYAWDGGWHTESIERRLLEIGLKMIAPPLSINEDPKTYKIRREDLGECKKLGRLVAKTVS